MQKSETAVEVTRTYLQMTSRDQLRASRVEDEGVRIDRLQNCPASFFRFLYAEVGRLYHWVDRLGWTDEEIRDYLSSPGVSLWVMYVEGSPAGYFELSKGEDGSTEVAYFGLLQEFLGRGLGKHLLSEAIDRAWEMGASRVWLHTCTLDDPAAMPNYLKRGLEPFKQETYLTTISPNEEQKPRQPLAQR